MAWTPARRTTLLAPLLFWMTAGAPMAGCAETPADPAPAVPGERSPEESEPAPVRETAQTGAVGAAGLERAVRIHEEDPEGALGLLRVGCDRGTVASCLALADLLASRNTSASIAESRAVLEQTCAAGSTEACDRLGH